MSKLIHCSTLNLNVVNLVSFFYIHLGRSYYVKFKCIIVGIKSYFHALKIASQIICQF